MSRAEQTVRDAVCLVCLLRARFCPLRRYPCALIASPRALPNVRQLLAAAGLNPCFISTAWAGCVEPMLSAQSLIVFAALPAQVNDPNAAMARCFTSRSCTASRTALTAGLTSPL